jgi:hypothetical protein
VEAGATAAPAPGADLEADLARIEAAVEAGQADLSAFGFWRIVATVKRDEALVARFADRIGRIDAAAFRTWAPFRLPVLVGNTVLLTGAACALAAVIVATKIASPVWAGVLLVGAGVAWSVALHCPTHWLVGWLFGIRFTDYFLGGPPPPRPGLKTDYATYLRADPAGRALMHASGAIATKIAPVLALVWWPATVAPWWAAAALVVVAVVQVLTDLVFSVRSSDWKRFRRERAVARERRRV